MEQVTATTYRAVPRTDPKDRIEVEVGDATRPEFQPQCKFKRWDNESNFSIRHIDTTPLIAPTVTFRDGIVKWIKPDIEVHQYEKPDASEAGGFEFEWVLNAPPISNVLEASIEFKDVAFYYQGVLTAEEIAVLGAQRPDRVIGSYAVYHTTKGVLVKAGGMKYATGKIGHIYRPEAVDRNGVKTWCDLHIDPVTKRLRVTVPLAYLATAAYPVKVDPTFGYTGSGGTEGDCEGVITMGRFSIGEDGTGTKISVNLQLEVHTNTVKCNVYQDETGEADTNVAALANGQTEERTLDVVADPTWHDFNFNSAPSFVSGTAYRLAFWSAATAQFTKFLYDSSIADQYTYTRTLTYGAWPNPSGTLSGFNDLRCSVYCTYTASGAINITPSAGGLSFSGTAPSRLLASLRNPSAANLALSTTAPTRLLKHLPAPAAGNLALSTTAPTRLESMLRSVGARDLSLSTTAPARVEAMARTPSAANLLLSGTAPTRLESMLRVPASRDLALSGTAPTRLEAMLRTPASGNVTLTFTAPSRLLAMMRDPAAAALVLSGTAPAVSTGGVSITVSPAAGALVFTVTAPSVQHITSVLRLLFAIDPEARTFTVGREPRTFEVEAQPRTSTIPRGA